jgi:hypothetical protein
VTGSRELRRLEVAWGVVLLVALAHRLALFLVHRADLDAYVAANASWYTYQNLPREMLRDHLWRSLLYLQQTPPASNLLMGIALKWFSWPLGCAYALIWSQSLICILAALVLVHLLAMFYPGRTILWTSVGILFVLNTDLVVLEYNSSGQTIYGPLTMLLLLVVLDRLLALRRTARMRDALTVGIAMGLLALTRPTWSLFSAVCIVLVGAIAPSHRRRAVLGCLLPIAFLQGGWAIKNWLVFGVFSLTTTTWAGMNARVGLTYSLGDELARFEREQVTVERGYPVWKVVTAMGDPMGRLAFPKDIGARDEAIEHAMGTPNPLLNTLTFREMCAQDERAILDFARAHPAAILRKWWAGYQVFWQPIANYGSQFVDLFRVGNHLVETFDVPELIAQLAAGTLPDTAYVVHGSSPLVSEKTAPITRTPTNLYTLRWLEPLILVLNLVGVHLLVPLVGVLCLVRWTRGDGGPTSAVVSLRALALVLVTTFYGYLAVLVNVVETKESMRYRLEVEPLIWLATLLAATELARLARRSEPASGRSFDDHQAAERRQARNHG